MKIKSITLFDLSKIIKQVNVDIVKFLIECDIKSKTDLTNIFISKILYKMVESYKSSFGTFTVFHVDTNLKLKFLSIEKSDINYKKFFKLIDKTIDFPIIASNIPYESFIKILKEDSPEYDEIVATHRSFVEILPQMYNVVKKYKYNKIDKRVLEEKEILLKLIEGF